MQATFEILDYIYIYYMLDIEPKSSMQKVKEPLLQNKNKSIKKG